MSRVRRVEAHAYKLYLSAQACEDNDTLSGVASDLTQGYGVNELSDLCEILNSLSAIADSKLKRKLIDLGHDERIRSRNLIPAIGMHWHVEKAIDFPDKMRIFLGAAPKFSYDFNKQDEPVLHGGVWLFKTAKDFYVAVSDGMKQ